MERTDLIEILRGNLSRIDEVDVTDVAPLEVVVTIYPKDVGKMLLSYLSGEISGESLTKWAVFITLRCEYGPPGWDDEEIGDYYEDMMYVIQRLSTPEIDGDICPHRVRGYLRELDKYYEDLGYKRFFK